MTAPAVGSRTSTRVNLGFDPHGRYAACLAGDPETDALTIESWTFARDAARRIPLPTSTTETFSSQLLARGPARVLVARQEPGAHQLVEVSARGGRVGQRILASPTSAEFRLLAPAGRSAPVAVLATDTDGSTAVSRIEPASGRLVPLARVDWPLRSGVWLDRRGRLLGTTTPDAHPVLLELAGGTVERLPVPGQEAHLLLASPESGRLLLASGSPGALRLAYHHRDGSPVATPPERLNEIAGVVLPLAFDPAGRRLALQVRRGARCHLMVHEIETDTVTELPTPAGMFDGVGAWNADRLWLAYRSPTCPTGLASAAPPQRTGPSVVRRRPVARWSLHGAAASPGWVPAHLEVFAGPAGDIEAVVYGDWRTAEQVVVALHGGPDAAWEMDFNPLLQAMAAAGLAVVAPNPRGSIGYGPAFRDAIRGRWGGPDLADVLAVARQVSRRRAGGRLTAYGESYGAFLAVLAAATAPHLWSRCAAVAPFLSTHRLRERATPTVRDMLDQLHALGPTATDPDLLRLGPRVTARLLLVHGEHDDVVPVEQTRTLHHRLRAAGRREGADFAYVEVKAAGHDPLHSPRQWAALARFLHDGDWSLLRCAAPEETHREPERR
jgi:dipeptidyl aminopeptidase/acylaminoacyl peptidase